MILSRGRLWQENKRTILVWFTNKIREVMRLSDKLYIGEIRIKEPKDPEEWMEKLLQIILHSESHRVLQTEGEKNVVRKQKVRK